MEINFQVISHSLKRERTHYLTTQKLTGAIVVDLLGKRTIGSFRKPASAHIGGKFIF